MHHKPTMIGFGGETTVMVQVGVKRQRQGQRHCSRSRNGFYHHCVLLSCLLLRNFSDLGFGLGFGTAQAFVSPLDQSLTRSRSRSNQNEHQPATARRARSKCKPNANANTITNVNTNNAIANARTQTSNTALHFFSILGNSNNNNNDDPNNSNNHYYEPDLPLARYVDVSANYTLAHTEKDYIDLEDGQRLVCVGDVHGDLEALKTFLETGGVYDRATDQWCGGNTIVVQCGDVLDRGMEELACYRLLSKLSNEAPLLGGGSVILLVGNHEALNAMGLFQYAFNDLEYEKGIGAEVDATLGAQNQWRKQYVNNQPARWASYEPGGLLAHSLLRNMKVAVRVGKTVCVHAGLTPDHLKDHNGISGMNSQYRNWISMGDDLEVAHEDFPKPLFHNPVVYNHHGNYPPDNPRQAWIDAEKRQKFYVNSIPPFLQSGPEPSGPIWMRDYSSPHDEPPRDDAAGTLERSLSTTLTLLDADRMVMGHTIQRRINGVFNGKAWRVDVGASRGCLGGSPEVLEVVCVRRPDGSLGEEVSVLTPHHRPTTTTTTATTTAIAATTATRTQHGNTNVNVNKNMNGNAQPMPPPPPGSVNRVPARDRLVDAYTQAAVQIL